MPQEYESSLQLKNNFISAKDHRSKLCPHNVRIYFYLKQFDKLQAQH